MEPLMSTPEIALFVLGVLAVVFFAVLMLTKALRASKPVAASFRFYPSTISPSQRDIEMIECSVDVIVVDEEGMMFIGFYSYDDMGGWVFMHDKAEPQGNFVWMYQPDNFHV